MLFILAVTNKSYNKSVFGLERPQEELGDLGWDVNTLLHSPLYYPG